MTGRRLTVLGFGVTALLVIAGIASQGRPLSRSRGPGPSATFFDYVFTTIVLFAVAVVFVVGYAVLIQRPNPWMRHRRRWRVVSTVVTLLAAVLLASLILRTGWEKRLQNMLDGFGGDSGGTAQVRKPPAGSHPRAARVRWDEIAVAAVLVGGATVLLLAGRRTRRPSRPWRLRSQEAVALALDESLDDLRSEPDVRRAIIAAYARMERALATAGIPRLPAEAPFEYLGRALVELDTSSEGVRRLTALFEWAKFSQHEPEPRMRDEAIDALVALRDELRRSGNPSRAEAAVA